jgi:hypothetical protein
MPYEFKKELTRFTLKCIFRSGSLIMCFEFHSVMDCLAKKPPQLVGIPSLGPPLFLRLSTAAMAFVAAMAMVWLDETGKSGGEEEPLLDRRKLYYLVLS